MAVVAAEQIKAQRRAARVQAAQEAAVAVAMERLRALQVPLIVAAVVVALVTAAARLVVQVDRV
jgi:hypothetical protein